MAIKLPYPFTNPLSYDIWRITNKFKDETYYEGCERVVKTILGKESTNKYYSDLYDAVVSQRIVFGGRTNANLGTSLKNVHPFNCYAYDCCSNHPNDSLQGIMDDFSSCMMILKSEGGVGINFSHLRPKGTYIKGIATMTGGVLPFMEIYNAGSTSITDSISSKSYQVPNDYHIKKKSRKGAMISLLNITHPDVIDYIHSKQNSGKFDKFNMSVVINDKFMNALLKDEVWELKFPNVDSPNYDKYWDGDYDKWEETFPDEKYVVYQTISARSLWDMLIKAMYNRNEPGILFIDNANKYNNLYPHQRYYSVNPCAEAVMIAKPYTVMIEGNKVEIKGDSCNLGSVNLVKYYDEECEDCFDYQKLRYDLKLLVRSLDNIIDVASFPKDEIKLAAKARRKIGVGHMGLGSLLMMLKMEYGSPDALKFYDKLMSVFANQVYYESALLAKEKGAFPCWKSDLLDGGYLKNSGVLDESVIKMIRKYGLRNSQLMAIAPNGNGGVINNLVSGGIEPVFADRYDRFVDSTHNFHQDMKDNGFDYPDITKGEYFETKDFKTTTINDEEFLTTSCFKFRLFKNGIYRKKMLCDYDYGLKHLLSRHITDACLKKPYTKTSLHLSVKQHLDMLKIGAKYIDQSISKTINVPNDYPIGEFSDLFIDAWKSGIRGLTVYRSGTMAAVLEVNDDDKNKFFDTWESIGDDVIIDNVALPSEYPMQGFTIKSEGKKWYFNIAYKDRECTKPLALFISTNHKESDVDTYGAIKSLETLARNEGILEKHIEDNQRKYRIQNNVTKLSRAVGLLLRHNVSILKIVETLDQIDTHAGSLVVRIKKFIAKYIEDGSKHALLCDECNGEMIYTEGCAKCIQCNHSKCD